jgi:glycosyltransferase involved in cell wall biosynthesis
MTIEVDPIFYTPKKVDLPVDVVIPARNEAGTIGGVVMAFTLSPAIGNIIVVCNQCDDGTQDKAMEAGALVLEQNKETGKGQTLRVGLDYVETPRVMFCDADLSGPVAEYVTAIAAPEPGRNGMIIGVTDYPVLSPVPWRVPKEIFALVSGQRSLPTVIAREVELHGYCVEAMINRVVQEKGLPIEYVYMRGVKGKVRNNSLRMAELRRDRKWLKENWK